MLIVLRHFFKRIGINIGDFKRFKYFIQFGANGNGRRMRVSSPFPLFYEILNIAHHSSINNIRYVHFKRIISNLLVSIQE
jgi:hypothetical protein